MLSYNTSTDIWGNNVEYICKPEYTWRTNSVPHKCPVCEGRGKVPYNFYDLRGTTTACSEEVCKSCWGTGILWS
jgi:DnaJ-class molecular chaperone